MISKYCMAWTPKKGLLFNGNMVIDELFFYIEGKEGHRVRIPGGVLPKITICHSSGIIVSFLPVENLVTGCTGFIGLLGVPKQQRTIRNRTCRQITLPKIWCRKVCADNQIRPHAHFHMGIVRYQSPGTCDRQIHS